MFSLSGAPDDEVPQVGDRGVVLIEHFQGEEMANLKVDGRSDVVGFVDLGWHDLKYELGRKARCSVVAVDRERSEIMLSAPRPWR